MSRVIKNNDGVAIVEGTPAASLVKDVDKFFKEKPPERMAGEVSKPRSLRDFKGGIPVSRRLSAEEEAFAAKLNEDRLAGIQRTPEEETALRDQMFDAGITVAADRAERRDSFDVSGDGKGRRSGRRVRQGFGLLSCPDPNMLILMADGSQKKAGDLVVGDLLKTNHEKSFELGEYKVEYVNVVNNVQKIKLIFDKTEIICSLTHKFLVDKSWKEAKDMEINDEVSGKKLLSIEKVEDGDVVHITVEDAHTYICEGLLSHNKRMRPPKKDEGADLPRTPRDSKPSRGSRPPKSKDPLPRDTVYRDLEDSPMRPAPRPSRRNEAKDKAESRRERFFQRVRSRKEARRSEKEREATKGRFITTLGR